jgi:hypothetical protein
MIIARQIKAARALLAWSKADLATQAGVPEESVARIESAEGPVGGMDQPGEPLLAALRRAGVVFLEGDSSGYGVRLRTGERDEGLRPEQLTTQNDD